MKIDRARLILVRAAMNLCSDWLAGRADPGTDMVAETNESRNLLDSAARNFVAAMDEPATCGSCGQPLFSPEHWAKVHAEGVKQEQQEQWEHP